MTLALASAMFLAGSHQVMANDGPVKDEKVFTESELERFKEVESRIMEIKGMNFSEMNRAEKKDIRAELNKEAKQLNGSGLYISTGALIVILILLIILL